MKMKRTEHENGVTMTIDRRITGTRKRKSGSLRENEEEDDQRNYPRDLE